MTIGIICGIIFKSQGARCEQQFAEGTPSVRSGCGAAGSALPWGGRGRKFKSCHSDQLNEQRKLLVFLCFIKLLGHFEATFKMPCFYALLRSFLSGATQFVTRCLFCHKILEETKLLLASKNILTWFTKKVFPLPQLPSIAIEQLSSNEFNISAKAKTSLSFQQIARRLLSCSRIF